MDQMVLETQQWLNATYGSDRRFNVISENGKTGWPTINALIRALQIELGLQSTADNFGFGTVAAFDRRYPEGVKQQADNATSKSNVYSIIQGALWCKGYSTGSGITQHFYNGTGNAIKMLKDDMGFSGNSTVELDIMKALLSMKQYVLLSNYGGTHELRDIQQSINRNFRDFTGLIPTDGLYGRDMNKALIQVLQAMEGFTPAQATGNFGSGTTARLLTISADNAADHNNWLWLASSALVANGYPAIATSWWRDETSTALRDFQRDHALAQTAILDRATWMSLLTSRGDPTRPVAACDTRFEITDELLAHLKADGYQIVGRYLSEPNQDSIAPQDYFKAIRPGELQRIVSGGMRYFPIYQEYSTALCHFSLSAARRHAADARNKALSLGVPPTVIYFTVDFDAIDDEVTSVIIPYFRELQKHLGSMYGIGIYGSRNVCSRVIAAGYAASAFVSDMSTGFSGNQGFRIPKAWNYDQIDEIKGYKRHWDLDRVAYSGKVPACSTVIVPRLPENPTPDPVTPGKHPLTAWVEKTETDCLEALGGPINPASGYRLFIGNFILGWLRKPEYWSSGGFLTNLMWQTYTSEPPLPTEMFSARMTCEAVCKTQPPIKGTIPSHDIAHMAATALGYLDWGHDILPGEYGLGDLGGWPLDLLQIWGEYERGAKSVPLAQWASEILGSAQQDSAFNYDDVLADADAWLLAREMKQITSERSLSKALDIVFKKSENERISHFYKKRFGASSDNVVSAFSAVADGVELLGTESGALTVDALKKAARVERLPNTEEVDTMARAYAFFLAAPTK